MFLTRLSQKEQLKLYSLFVAGLIIRLMNSEQNPDPDNYRDVATKAQSGRFSLIYNLLKSPPQIANSQPIPYLCRPLNFY